MDAELCSDSNSINAIGSSHRFVPPLATTIWYPEPIVVEDVIGYAHAACEI